MLLAFNFTLTRPQCNHPTPKADSTRRVKVHCLILEEFLERRERIAIPDLMAWYRRNSVGTNGWHVSRCFQAFASLPGLSRASFRNQTKVSVSMGVTETMCVTSISPHSLVF